MSTIELNDLAENARYRNEVNENDIAKVQVTLNGVPMEIPADVREELRYVGLSTDYLLRMYFQVGPNPPSVHVMNISAQDKP